MSDEMDTNSCSDVDWSGDESQSEAESSDGEIHEETQEPIASKGLSLTPRPMTKRELRSKARAAKWVESRKTLPPRHAPWLKAALESAPWHEKKATRKLPRIGQTAGMAVELAKAPWRN
jgi:hypothetical protein